MKPQTMWFIQGRWPTQGGGEKHFLYAGGYSTRRDTIWHHCRDFGGTWTHRRAKGDRAMKCKVTPCRS